MIKTKDINQALCKKKSDESNQNEVNMYQTKEKKNRWKLINQLIKKNY